MNTKPICYGLKNGEIVNISDVERGLACGCTCLECGAKLEAHQGEKNIYHFKHHNREERINCYETAIHLASKKLFSIKKLF
jgi:competence CoiA-like predicted nuclease